jgi:cellulose synthase operon protein C
MSDERASMHDKVDAFADGELPPEEAEAFRAHLVECAECQAELRDIMMLGAVTAPLAATAAAPVKVEPVKVEPADKALPPIIPLASRRRRVFIAVTTALAAAAAIVVAWKVARPEPIVLAQADKRPLEARLSYAAADHWRPYDVERAAAVVREEVRVDTLARLEAKGEWRGLADGYLLGGEPERAAEALARAGESADVESDRAALALQKHDAAMALAHAARALALAPGHAQGAWNRALALRELGLTRAAANAFEAIAQRGEKGWSDEARQRAASLRAADSERERSWNEADAAAKTMLTSGAPPAEEIVRAYPGLVQDYVRRALGTSGDKSKLLALLPPEARVAWDVSVDDEQAAKEALERGDSVEAAKLLADADRRCLAVHIDYRCASLEYALAFAESKLKRGADAEKTALAGWQRARDAGVDPRDLPRRFLVLLADVARAQDKTALADAYVDEARLLMPVR